MSFVNVQHITQHGSRFTTNKSEPEPTVSNIGVEGIFWGYEGFLPEKNSKKMTSEKGVDVILGAVFSYFVQIFTKSKLLGVRLHHRLLHQWYPTPRKLWADTNAGIALAILGGALR